MREYNLTQAEILLVLRRENRPLSTRELQPLVGRHIQTVQMAVSNLVALGQIIRAPSERRAHSPLRDCPACNGTGKVYRFAAGRPTVRYVVDTSDERGIAPAFRRGGEFGPADADVRSVQGSCQEKAPDPKK